MPVALLVEAAVGFLKANGEDITSDRVLLMHEKRFMDATFERLSDHDVEPEDSIEILVSCRQVTQPNPDHHDSGTPIRGRPRTRTPPRARHNSQHMGRGDSSSEREPAEGISKRYRLRVYG